MCFIVSFSCSPFPMKNFVKFNYKPPFGYQETNRGGRVFTACLVNDFPGSPPAASLVQLFPCPGFQEAFSSCVALGNSLDCSCTVVLLCYHLTCKL